MNPSLSQVSRPAGTAAHNAHMDPRGHGLHSTANISGQNERAHLPDQRVQSGDPPPPSFCFRMLSGYCVSIAFFTSTGIGIGVILTKSADKAMRRPCRHRFHFSPVSLADRTRLPGERKRMRRRHRGSAGRAHVHRLAPGRAEIANRGQAGRRARHSRKNRQRDLVKHAGQLALQQSRLKHRQT